MLHLSRVELCWQQQTASQDTWCICICTHLC